MQIKKLGGLRFRVCVFRGLPNFSWVFRFWVCVLELRSSFSGVFAFETTINPDPFDTLKDLLA